MDSPFGSLACVLVGVLSASAAAAQEFGTLSIQARPAGAEILIDGEHWDGSGDSGPLQVQLAPGSHCIEIARRDGGCTCPTSLSGPGKRRR